MGSQSNYQNWEGTTDPRYGYGMMLKGFMDSVPRSVVFDSQASVDVYMGVPFTKTGWLSGAYRVCFTMWETDTLPANFRHWVGEYDQILVPCDHNVDLFSQHHRNVTKVPLGVNGSVWFPRKRERSGPFRFHAGGSLWRRKGLDLVVKAFQKAAIPDTELHIKAAPQAFDAPQKLHGENIFLYRGWMTPEEQTTWFHQADCYIAASRGEGWGLMPLQAIRAGIPTILSNSTGHQEFLDLATKTVTCTKSKADTIGQWDEPNLEELIEQMRWTVTNHDTAQTIATENSPKTDKYLWTKSTRTLLKTLPTGQLLNNTTRIIAAPTVASTTLRKVDATIANKRWKLQPDTDYLLPETVFRVLSDSGAVKETQ